MSLVDPDNRLGGPFESVVVAFNARVEYARLTVADFAERRLAPHPNQPARMAGEARAGRLTVPPRSVSVFVVER
jgi:hypothetical protein